MLDTKLGPSYSEELHSLFSTEPTASRGVRKLTDPRQRCSTRRDEGTEGHKGIGRSEVSYAPVGIWGGV
jgi:hypothetical protein